MESIGISTLNGQKHADLTARFVHPDDVLSDRTLSQSDKRAILASWVSDKRAVEGAPNLRHVENGAIVAVTDVLAALEKLDTMLSPARRKPRLSTRHRMMLMGEAIRVRRRPPEDDDDPPPVSAIAPRPKPPKRDAEAALLPVLEIAIAA